MNPVPFAARFCYYFKLLILFNHKLERCIQSLNAICTLHLTLDNSGSTVDTVWISVVYCKWNALSFCFWCVDDRIFGSFKSTLTCELSILLRRFKISTNICTSQRCRSVNLFSTSFLAKLIQWNHCNWHSFVLPFCFSPSLQLKNSILLNIVTIFEVVYDGDDDDDADDQGELYAKKKCSHCKISQFKMQCYNSAESNEQVLMIMFILALALPFSLAFCLFLFLRTDAWNVSKINSLRCLITFLLRFQK